MKYYFGDNREYGAGDIKKALGALAATGGIELGLSDGKEYTPSKLNAIIAAAVSRGVITDSNTCLRLEKSGDGYYIRPGRGVFADGGVAEVEERTKVDAAPGQYLYIAYNSLLDDVYFLTDSQERSDGDGLLLIPVAYVENGGSVVDKRVFARGKLPALPSSTWNVLREEEFVIDDSTVTHGDIGVGGYLEARHPIDGEINFMLVRSTTRMGVMLIGPNGPEYQTVAGGGGNNDGVWTEFLSVGYMDAQIKATYLDSGPGYISLRYHMPGKLANSRRFAYKALVGIAVK